MQNTQKEFSITAQWSVLGTSISIESSGEIEYRVTVENMTLTDSQIKRISKSLVEIVEGVSLEEAIEV